MSDLTSWWQMPHGNATVSNIFINMKRVLFIGGTSSYDYVKIKSYNQFFFDNLDLHDQVSERVVCESHLSVRNIQ